MEWRGDPREAHRRYLSTCDLSIISDAEEDSTVVDTESVSSGYTRSLLQVAGQGGSQDSMQSVGTLDSLLVSRASDSTNKGTN